MPGKKVLVADDSLTIQKVIRLALANEGYQIQAVSDGKEAIEQIALFQPDLCLIDVSLPRKNAFEVKKHLQEVEDFKNLKFILMSSAFEQIDEKQIEEAHFDGRLIKPFDPAHLRRTLSEVLGSVSTPREKAGFELDSDDEPSLPTALPALPTPPPFTPPSNVTGFLDIPSSEAEFENMWAAAESTKVLEKDTIQDDIKKLTESTLKMSGLDAMGWTVNEPSKKHALPPIEISYMDQVAPVLEPTRTIIRDDTPSTIPVSSGASASEIRSEIERIIKAEFPALMEKVIREEIHKLLQNPPKGA